MKAFALLASLTLLCITANAQRMRYTTYAHNEWYLKEAAEHLPAWYKQGAYDSILAYVTTTEKATGHPYLFATRLLVKLQLNRLDDSTFKRAAFLDSLEHYAYMVRASQATTPSVSNEVGARLEDMPYEDRLYLFNTVWARLLPTVKQLDSTQAFLCSVIEGKVPGPMVAIRARRGHYPALDSLLLQQRIAERNSFSGSLYWGFGTWAPQGNAVILGVHPALSLALGGRDKLNEVNLLLTARFGRTPQDYQILRGDSLYSRHYFGGVYAGAEYTRYLYHSLRFEAGLTAGIGYDAINFAVDDDNHSNDYLKPFNAGSLNLNAGIRLNYYFSSSGYVGLKGQFNKIDYKNKGGTPIDGNAYSITVILGHN